MWLWLWATYLALLIVMARVLPPPLAFAILIFSVVSIARSYYTEALKQSRSHKE